MTVAELITELEKLSPNKEVILTGPYDDGREASGGIEWIDPKQDDCIVLHMENC